MRLLVLEGTRFVGRGLVEAALAAGHDVSLFNRGRTGATLFPEVERLTGDRDGNLDALTDREWELWFPGGDGWSQVDNTRAVAAGLTLRPLAETDPRRARGGAARRRHRTDAGAGSRAARRLA